jgi:hypothetical protein
VRPAAFARHDTGQTQNALIQFQPGSSGAWQTIDTVPVTNPRGYIDVRLALPASGSVRLAWSYPASDRLLGSGTVYSRTVSVTVK